MSEPIAIRPPAWYWLVSGLFLLWSLAGCLACYVQLTIDADGLAALPPAQRDAWEAMTLLPKAAYIVAVAAGLAGAIELLLHKRLARALFILSLAAVLVQFGWFFGPYGGLGKLGASAAAFPAFIIAVSIAEIWFAGLAISRGWLR